jgi:hypothetical protein
MKSNAKATLGPPTTINPLTKMWRIISNFAILSCKLHLKLYETNKNCHDSNVGFNGNERIFSNLNFINTKIQNWLTNNLALCVRCLGNHFLQCIIFFMMKLWAFGSQRNANILWTLKVYLVTSCLVPNKPCVVVLFSLPQLWFYCFWLFIGFLTCYCYMWT